VGVINCEEAHVNNPHKSILEAPHLSSFFKVETALVENAHPSRRVNVPVGTALSQHTANKKDAKPRIATSFDWLNATEVRPPQGC